jgi:hypothetical protein
LAAGSKTVGDDLLADQRHDLAHVGVVCAEHRHAVEGQPLNEVHEGLLQAAEVVAIGFHVVAVDVGDDRQHRRQQEEGGIGLVGLGDEEVTRPETRVGAGRVEPTANDECRVHATSGEDRSHQTGRRGLAMCAGNCDSLLEPHQLGEHLCPWHHRYLAGTRSDDLRIVGPDRRRDHHGVGRTDVLGGVTDDGADAELGKPPGRRAVGEIGTADRKAEIRQDLGDAAHAGTTDADEMNALDLVFHSTSSSHIRASAAVASGLARARACSAIDCNLRARQLVHSSAIASGVRSSCGSRRAAPAADRKRALSV